MVHFDYAENDYQLPPTGKVKKVPKIGKISKRSTAPHNVLNSRLNGYGNHFKVHILNIEKVLGENMMVFLLTIVKIAHFSTILHI